MATRRSRPGRLSPQLGLLLLVVAAAATAAMIVAARRRRSGEASRPADVGFMLAMHNAFRRDLARLEKLATDTGTPTPAGEEFQREWGAFRERLHRHHNAEDDDLWPVLRDHLTATADLASVDRMVEEHQALSEAMDRVDQALSAPRTADTGGDLTAALDRLSRTARGHLDHEEREVLPLVENHLSRADWRAFLVTERRQTPVRARPEFLGWVLDEASPDDARAVLAELPPPGRLAYRFVIAPRYRSRQGRRPITAAAASR
jgi:hemerythrin-like domain-containing protein